MFVDEMTVEKMTFNKMTCCWSEEKSFIKYVTSHIDRKRNFMKRLVLPQKGATTLCRTTFSILTLSKVP
jgi:hypothetical protein